jgi:prophage regulatory protein
MATQPNKLDVVLRWPEVQARIPFSRSHAHALAAQGKFPKPIKLGPRASGWLEREIVAWLAQRVAESRGGEV